MSDSTPDDDASDTPASATSAPPTPSPSGVGIRHQQAGPVIAVLDGGAHLHVWEPNRDGDRIDNDLTDSIALLAHLGLQAAPPTEPHWTDTGGSTVIVSLDLGPRGQLLVDGYEASADAALALVAAGFVQLLRDAVSEPTVEPEQSGPHLSGRGGT